MALFSRAKTVFRRRMRRPGRLARRLRKDVVKAVRLSQDNEKLRKDILDLARRAEKDKKAIKELRNSSADLVKISRKNIDYFVAVFVDAEALVLDASQNISVKLKGALINLARQGYPQAKMVQFRSKFLDYNTKLLRLSKDIQLLTRKAEKGRGGLSISSTARIEREVRKTAKELHGLRKDIGDVFDDLHKHEERLSISGIEEDLNSLFEKINRELLDIKVVTTNNRILVKRFKDALRKFGSNLASVKIPDEQVKRVLIKAAEHIEAYEDKALRQARRIAYRGKGMVKSAA